LPPTQVAPTDRERLADDVSATFHAYVRLSRHDVAGTEEVVLTVA